MISPTSKERILWLLWLFLLPAKPMKSQYRHFKIKTVEGPNDFASMHEVITRRFRHASEEIAGGIRMGKICMASRSCDY